MKQQSPKRKKKENLLENTENKIYKKGNKLVIEVPLTVNRYNPYSNSIVGKMPNIIGLILLDPKNNNEEMGFAYRIDVSYKGKNDQWTDFFYKWFNDRESFEKLCKKLKIDVVILPSEPELIY